MAEIPYYNAGSLPSLAVSPPGANMVPGQTFRSLSSNIGDTLSQFRQTQMAKLNILGSLARQAPYLGQAIGRSFAAHENMKAAHVQAYGVSKVADNAHSFADNADEAFKQIQKQYVNNPEQASGAMTDYLDQKTSQYTQQLQDDPTFKGDPAFANKFKNKADDIQRVMQDRVDNWSSGQQKDNGHAFLLNADQSAVQSVDQAEGTLVDKFQSYVAANANFKILTSAKEPLFGKEQMETMRQNTMVKTGTALLTNIITNTPNDPQERIPYLDGLKGFVEKTNIPLPDKAKEQALKAIHAAGDQAATEWADSLNVGEDDHKLTIQLQINKLVANPYKPVNLNSARNFVDQQTAAITQQRDAVRNNKFVPDKVKKAADTLFDAQISHIGALSGVIERQQEHITNGQESDERQAQAYAKQQEAEGRRENREQARDQREQARGEVNALRLQAAVLDPIKDAAKIQALGKEIAQRSSFYGKATAADGRPVFSSDKDYAIQSAAVSVTKHSAAVQSKAPNFMEQIFHNVNANYQIPYHKEKQDAQSAAQSKAAKGVLDGLNTLGSIHKHDQLNDLSGMSETQRDSFHRREAAVREGAAKPHSGGANPDGSWTADQVDYKLNSIRAEVMKNVPASVPHKAVAHKAPAQKKPGDYFVPPPPPYTPSVMPENPALAEKPKPKNGGTQ